MILSRLRAIPRPIRIAIFVAIGGLTLGLVFWLVPPFPQPQEYHKLVDQRAQWGIPRFSDVASNILFVIAGVWGWFALRRSERPRGERWLWALFFLCVIGVGFGSAYYHYEPEDAGLLWDRIPIALGSGFLVWVLICERMRGAASGWLGSIWLLLSIGGVVWWAVSESFHQGDLRLYGYVTFYPMLAILLLIWFFPPRYDGTGWLVTALCLYVLSRLAEVRDVWVFWATGELVSGHTLKHVFAALGVMCLARYVRLRALRT